MRVVLALIRDSEERVLLTQRSWQVPGGGLWEFPGGKIEVDETPVQAMIREIKEELGIEIENCRLLGEWQGSGKPDLLLILYEVLSYRGVPQLLEGQLALQWVHQAELQADIFPPANQDLIASLLQAPLFD